MKFSLYDVVTLDVNLPDSGLTKGMIGTVVDVYSSPFEAYEIEFCDDQGQTIELLPLEAGQLKLLQA